MSPQATLTVSVYPGGFFDTSFHFEYGPTDAYGSYSPLGAAGAGLDPFDARVLVGGLRPGVAYHFRIVAWNAEGASYGADRVSTVTAANAP